LSLLAGVLVVVATSGHGQGSFVNLDFDRVSDSGNFIQWFSQYSFGGTNYENTPVGAVCNGDEPFAVTPGVDPSKYFGLWASGKNFAVCAWISPASPRFFAVGDPFVKR